MSLIDTHAHINFPQFDVDRPEVIARLKEVGVTQVINVGTDAKTSEESVELSHQLDFVSAAVGIHPHSADDLDAQFDTIRQLAKDPKVVAIGEIGLDYFRNLSTPANQIEAFRKQLDLALFLKKPIIIHCRDAYAEVLAILETDYLPKVSGYHPGIIHSFAVGPSYAQKFVKLGFCLGINNMVTYPANTQLVEAVSLTPLDRLVLETDAPYLPPQHLKGQRCEPAYVAEVARKIAEIKQVSVKEVLEVTAKTAQSIFWNA